MYNRQQGQYTTAQWQQMQQQQWQQMQQMQQMNQTYSNPYSQQGQSTGYVKKQGCGCGKRSSR